MTNGPLPQVRKILGLYREVADEVICIVNSRFDDDELAELNDVADRIIRVEMLPGFSIGHYRAWERSLPSTADWVLVVDHDEVPSARFLRDLPQLLDVKHVVSYRLEKRWLYPDSQHWLAAAPWCPNQSPALIRNDPNILHFNSALHEGTISPFPSRDIDGALYHLTCLLTAVDERRKKIARYRQAMGVSPDAVNDTTETMYLPEDFRAPQLSHVPAEDTSLIDAVLSKNRVPGRVIDARQPIPPEEPIRDDVVTYAEVAKYWPGKTVRSSAYHASLSLLDWNNPTGAEPFTMKVGSSLQWGVMVTNDGAEIWPRALREPPIALGSRWWPVTKPRPGRIRRRLRLPALDRRMGGVKQPKPAEIDESRSAFGADVHPGETVTMQLEIRAPSQVGNYVLSIDVVHEGVRWFQTGISIPVVVEGP